MRVLRKSGAGSGNKAGGGGGKGGRGEGRAEVGGGQRRKIFHGAHEGEISRVKKHF